MPASSEDETRHPPRTRFSGSSRLECQRRSIKRCEESTPSIAPWLFVSVALAGFVPAVCAQELPPALPAPAAAPPAQGPDELSPAKLLGRLRGMEQTVKELHFTSEI
jgi:hypothetical protein